MYWFRRFLITRRDTNKQRFRSALLVALIATLPFQCQRGRPPGQELAVRPEKPNVLLIVIDTLRCDDSGADRPSASSASFFSRLASQGIVFSSSYSTFDETID